MEGDTPWLGLLDRSQARSRRGAARTATTTKSTDRAGTRENTKAAAAWLRLDVGVRCCVPARLLPEEPDGRSRVLADPSELMPFELAQLMLEAEVEFRRQVEAGDFEGDESAEHLPTVLDDLREAVQKLVWWADGCTLRLVDGRVRRSYP